jgi:hypothetical protein
VSPLFEGFSAESLWALLFKQYRRGVIAGFYHFNGNNHLSEQHPSSVVGAFYTLGLIRPNLWDLLSQRSY